jgi:cytoskeleton protein RodZ
MPITPAPAPAPPPPPAAPAKAELVLRIETVPPGATIVIDGEAQGETPIDYKLAEPRTITLALTRDGYLPHRQELLIDRDQRVLIPLAQAPKPAAAAPPAKPKPKPKPKAKKDPKDPFQRFD